MIINVVDASALERNLYLTLQLLELGKPVILASEYDGYRGKAGHGDRPAPSSGNAGQSR